VAGHIGSFVRTLVLKMQEEFVDASQPQRRPVASLVLLVGVGSQLQLRVRCWAANVAFALLFIAFWGLLLGGIVD
jgi:hypothetical protein